MINFGKFKNEQYEKETKREITSEMKIKERQKSRMN
jgi:hypothetical protein